MALISSWLPSSRPSKASFCSGGSSIWICPVFTISVLGFFIDTVTLNLMSPIISGKPIMAFLLWL